MKGKVKKIWTKEKIKKVLLEEYKNNNYITLSCREIQENKNLPSSRTLYDFYHKGINEIWKEVIEEEGLGLNFRQNEKSKTKITKEIIIKRIMMLYKKLGKVPSFDEYKKEYSFNQIRDRFGSYTNALIEAGLSEKWKIGMSKEEMISYLKEKVDDGTIISYNDLKFKKESPGLKIIFRALKCKSVKEVIKIIDRNIIYNQQNERTSKSLRDKTDEELIEEYKLLSKKLGKVKGATAEEINYYLGYCGAAFASRFMGFKNLRKLAGYKHEERKTKWDKEQLIIVLRKEYKKNNNRKLKLSQIELNKNLPSSITIKKYFNEKHIKDVWGEVLKNSI